MGTRSNDAHRSARHEPSTHELLNEATRALHARVKVFWDGGSALHWLGAAGEITLGRSIDCDLVIDHASVSRKHAKLRGGCPGFIEDLDSVNGVRVRGKRIDVGTPVAVFPGDVVELGSTVLVLEQPVGAPGRSPERVAEATPSPMDGVARLIELVAKGDLGVILLGETGVGKTVAAQTIHKLSPRSARPFVRLNCAAFPEALLEGELFGYERGAFTGAMQSKAGLIESADGGTVFLDEIGEMPLMTQAKLLGVVESHDVMRLGSLKARRVDIRFVAATNRDLEARIVAGAFREDLYFRLNGLSIVIPPLRERQGDLPGLIERFLEQASARAGKSVTLSPEAFEALLGHRWPGNLRELRNIMDRAVTLCDSTRVELEHLVLGAPARSVSAPPTAQPPVADATELRRQLDAVERQRIVDALEQCQGNQTRAARMLGLSRRSLITLIEAHALPRPRKNS